MIEVLKLEMEREEAGLDEGLSSFCLPILILYGESP
jgi:hypothetical protein